MEQTIHRIEQLREHYELSPKELEKKLGMSNGSWEKALNRNSSIKDNIIRKVVEVYPEVNLRWLVFGEGEMFGKDIMNPKELATYIVENHTELCKKSELFRLKVLEIGMDAFAKKYGGLFGFQKN
jgi:transcriptional regulator with XRE-family HTH domain